MGIKINMDGVNISGNSKVFNNMRVSGDSEVQIGIKDSEIKDKAKVLTDMDIQSGRIDLNIDGATIIGKDVEFMSSRINREDSQNRQSYQEPEATASSRDTTSGTRTNISIKTTTSKPKEKIGLLRRILNMLINKGQDIGTEVVMVEGTSSTKNAHDIFVGRVSGNGEYRNIDKNVARQVQVKDNIDDKIIGEDENELENEGK